MQVKILKGPTRAGLLHANLRTGKESSDTEGKQSETRKRQQDNNNARERPLSLEIQITEHETLESGCT